ncbi:hypothetical protein [Clostridium sp. YIM B02551]|nr:hypothetical protein [Clostridium sp. YIM B02551]
MIYTRDPIDSNSISLTDSHKHVYASRSYYREFKYFFKRRRNYEK